MKYIMALRVGPKRQKCNVGNYGIALRSIPFIECIFCSRGVPWPSGLVHQICVLMAELSECGFESWPRPWCLCPWARHFTIIASLHPGANGYLWGQSWLLCLISPMCAVMAAVEVVYSPGSCDGFTNDLCTGWAGVIMCLEHQKLMDTCVI